MNNSESKSALWLHDAQQKVEETRAKLTETQAIAEPWLEARRKLQEQSTILEHWSGLLRRHTRQRPELTSARTELNRATRRLRMRRTWRFVRITQLRRDVWQLRRSLIAARVNLMTVAAYALFRWIIYSIRQLVITTFALVRQAIQAIAKLVEWSLEQLVNLFDLVMENPVIAGAIVVLIVLVSVILIVLLYLNLTF
jgi:hypothetical protein